MIFENRLFRSSLNDTSIESLKRILDNIGAYIYVSNPENGKLLFVNRQLKAFLGRENDNLVGETCWKVFRGTDGMCDFCPCHSLNEGSEKTVVWEEYYGAKEKYIQHSDCYIDWPDGTIAHLQHSVDITELKDTTSKLDRRLVQQSLMTQISESFFSNEDMDTLLTNALREVAEFMQISQILLLKAADDELTIFCQNGWIDPKYNMTSRVGNTIKISEALLDIFKSLNAKSKFYVTSDDPDVSEVMKPFRLNFFNYLATSIFINDKLYAILDFSRAEDSPWSHNDIQIASFTTNILTSVLQKHEMEEQLIHAKEVAERSSSYKTAFLANMSHEIRTPMNAVIGMAELALRETESEAKDKHIYTVKQAASNLLAIINDILDFSKIEAGKLEIITGEYSIATMLSDVVSIIRMKVVDSQVRFAVKVDSTIPRTLYGDETRIRQAVLNLLSNAVKYTDKGSVTFSVLMDSKGTDTGTVNLIFEVTDTGIGIKQEDMGKLFSDFTQLDLDKHRGVEGVGLGLAITRNIVQAMGGKIDVSSVYGEGSTFKITVPQKFDYYEPLARIKDPGKAKVIILIFERRNVNSESLTYTLNNLGVECTVVTDGKMLQELMSSRTFDYIFLPFSLYEENEDTIQKFGTGTKVVILSEFGEAVPEKDMFVLTMPAYCTHIADVFNGVSDNLSHRGGGNVARFRAPSAKVLVVDDIKTNLKVTEGLLAPFNMQVDLCNGGLAAVNAVLSLDVRYDLIFMDHKMPGVDGVEATRRIRALGEENPYFAQVPIIALTANAVSGMQEMFFENGFNDFLSKPIDTVMLSAILEKWIPKSKQEHK